MKKGSGLARCKKQSTVVGPPLNPDKSLVIGNFYNNIAHWWMQKRDKSKVSNDLSKTVVNWIIKYASHDQKSG